MPDKKRPAAKRAASGKAQAAPRPVELDDEEMDEGNGQSLYRRMKTQYGDDEEGFYRWLREHHLEDTSVCLGFYLKRAERELNLNQADVAARTGTRDEPPLTRSFISALLRGRPGIRADTWVRIAKACDANPLEFFLAEGWIEQGDISAYKVPHANMMLGLARKLDDFSPAFQQTFITMAEAMADTLLQQQTLVEGSTKRASTA